MEELIDAIQVALQLSRIDGSKWKPVSFRGKDRFHVRLSGSIFYGYWKAEAESDTEMVSYVDESTVELAKTIAYWFQCGPYFNEAWKS